MKALSHGIAIGVLGVALAGCASYDPAPLRPATDVLAAPTAAILATDAASMDRPFLTPEPVDLGKPLTPNALAIIAIIENPDLKAQRAKAGVTDAQAFAARLVPDPSLQANFDKILSGPDVFNGFGAQLGVDLGLIRSAGAIRASTEAARRQVRLDLAWAEWQTAGQARLLGVRILALDAQRALAESTASSASHWFDTSARAAARGDLAAAEVDTRRQALLDATDKLRTLERDLATAHGDLNHLLGLAPDVRLQLAPPPPPQLPPSSDILLALALDRRLDLQALRAGYEVTEADLHKAVLDQFPNLSLAIAGARDTANNYTLGPSVGFTLPLWNRNRGGIAVARATREQVKAEYEARLFQTRAEIEAAIGALDIVRRQISDLRAQLPQIQRLADRADRAALRGDIAQATAETAQQALRDRKSALIQLEQQAAEQTIALELLSGGPSQGWTK